MRYSQATDYTLLIQPKLYATPAFGMSLTEDEARHESMWMPPQIDARVGDTLYSRQAISTLMLSEARNNPSIFEYAAEATVHQMRSWMDAEQGWTKMAKALTREMMIADQQIEAWKKTKGVR